MNHLLKADRFLSAAGLALAVGLVLAPRTSAATAAGPADEVLTIPLPGGAPRIDHTFGLRPLVFEPNVGQTDAQVKFLARGNGYQLFLTATEAVMVLSSPNASEGAERLGVRQPSAALRDAFGFGENREFTALSNTFESGAGAPQSRTLTRGLDAPDSVESSPSPRHSRVLRMRLVGANDSPPVQGEVKLTGKVNYFIGNDPSHWRTNLPTFAKVQYRDVYPGTDLVYYGNQEGRLEYDFVLAPGADPNLIALEVDGADRIELDAHGDLIAWVGGHAVRWQKPLVYQEFDGQRIEVAGTYRLDDGFLTYQGEGSHRIGFELAAYDRAQPLVIDPVLVYSTFLGGSSGSEDAWADAADDQGNAYVVGRTDSLDFPTKNAFQPERLGSLKNYFVTKIGPTGQQVFSTYLGPDGASGVGGGERRIVAVDALGNIYVTGSTISTNFPLVNPLQPFRAGSAANSIDLFLSILNSDGASLRFSTYLGGTDHDFPASIAIDSSTNIYLAGSTSSADFPLRHAMQPQINGGLDGFIVKLEAGGRSILYSTFLGGSGNDFLADVVTDSEGKAYIAGNTFSADFPVRNAYQPFKASPDYPDFVYAKIQPDGSDLVYSSYFGGDSGEFDAALALRANGSLYLTGYSVSSGLATPGAYQTSAPDWFNILARFNATDGSLVAATYLDPGIPISIAIDADGSVIIGGSAYENRPMVNPIQSQIRGDGDGFVAKFSPDLSSLLFSTYLGGSGGDGINSIALAPNGDLIVCGVTSSTNFPTLNAFQSNLNGSRDCFVAKISMAEVLKISRTSQTVTLSWPIGATNFVLEATTSVPAVSWATVTNTPTVTTNERSVQLPLTGTAKFFRLRKP